MKNHLWPYLLVFLATTQLGCQSFARDAMLERTLRHSSKLKSFEGTIKEEWKPGENSLTSEVFYNRPDFYSMITSPGALRGSWACYLGQRLLIYYPSTKFAIDYKNLTSISPSDAEKLIQDRFDLDLNTFDFTLGSEVESSGVTAVDMKFRSKSHDFWITGGQSYVYDEFSFPVFHKIELKDGQTYSYKFEKIKFNTEIPKAKFKCELPDDAILSDWDLNSKNYSAKEVVEAGVNVKIPKKLKGGIKLSKIIRQKGPLAAFNFIYQKAPYFLFLTVFKDYKTSLVPDGPRLKLSSGNKGELVFFSSITTYTFSLSGTVYTLTSNLSPEELIEVGDSI